MPVSFNSPPRNFFLLGSGSEQGVTNFFHNINRSSSTDGQYSVSDTGYTVSDQKFLLAGTGKDSNTVSFGFIEKQAYDAETDPANPTNVEAWRTKINSTVSGNNCTLNFMRQTSEYGGNIIVGGKSNGVPWISKFDSNGVELWRSTSQTADVEYFDVTVKSDGTSANDKIYACGYKNVTGSDDVAFVEKWDGNGGPLWGKSATRIGGDVRLNAIAANDRDQVVAVGAIDGVEWQGYVVKIDANTGDIIWDLTINSGEEYQAGSKNPIELRDVYIDANDQIYIVGSESIYDGGVINNGVIFKYTAEGNLIWQKRTAVGEEQCYYKVWSDTAVEQTIVLSHEVVAGSPTKRGPSLIKYSKNGDIVFKRRIQSSTNFADSSFGLEGDPSFYYILFVDEQENVGTGASKTYNFGKVSSSGNGFGEFTYDATNSKTITYSVNSAADRIGRLSDGSVRNDTSDQISYPYNGLKTLFDDYAINIAYKKTRHEEKDVFSYGGSPSIRSVSPDLLSYKGETYDVTTGGEAQGQQAYTTSGSYTWTAPAGVTSVSVVCVGGGSINGAALAYRNNITVVPGTGYSVVVGGAGSSTGGPGASYSDGGDSTFSDGTNTTIAEGGSGNTQTPATPSGTYDGGGNGGISGDGIGNVGYGGGGAGGYSGNGGNNLAFSPWSTDGAGGGGAGGAWAYYAGGGVGILGEGASGQATNADGGGGSGGQDGQGEGTEFANSQTGGNYGGGGSGRWTGNKGGGGAVRIIWPGDTRQFPSTLTADQTTSTGPTTTTYVKDQLGNDNHATISGPTLTTTNPIVWDFAGGTTGTQVIDTGVNAGSVTNLTIECWIKVDTYTNSGSGITIGDTGATRSSYLGVGTSGGNSIDWRFYLDPYQQECEYFTDSNDWQHVVGTYDQDVGYGTMRLYVNGVLRDTAINTGNTSAIDFSSGRNILLGTNNFNSADGDLDGKIGEVHISKKTLTAGEVFQNYNATKSKYINEAPDTAPKIGPGIVYGTNLILNYDFGNRACIDRVENLIPWSHDKGNWNPGSGGTLVRNAGIAPDGTMTATKATISSNDIDVSPSLGPASEGASTQIPISGSTTYTFSIWAKASTPDQVGNNFKVRWKRITGDAISAETTFALTADWKRYSCTGTTAANNTTMACFVGGVDGSEALVWGAQLEKGSSVVNEGAGRLITTYGTAITAPTTVKNISISNPVHTFTGTFNDGPTFVTAVANIQRGALYTIPCSVSGSTVTVTEAGHPLINGQSVKVKLQLENPSMVIYNSDFSLSYTVTVVDANTFTYDLGSSTHTGYTGRAFYYDPVLPESTGGYMYFDPDTTKQRVSFSGTGLAVGTGDYTIEMWVHHTEPWNQQTYFSDEYGDTAGPYFAKQAKTSTNHVGLYYSSSWTLEGTTDLLDHTWYHVVVSRISGTSTLYVNATSEDSASDTVNITNTDMHIGDSPTSSGQMKGYIGETRFYTKGLSATEVSQNFNATRGKYGV